MNSDPWKPSDSTRVENSFVYGFGYREKHFFCVALEIGCNLRAEQRNPEGLKILRRGLTSRTGAAIGVRNAGVKIQTVRFASVLPAGQRLIG